MNIGIYIYQDAEVLDFSGPFEVFSTANRFLEQKNKVYLLAETLSVVSARGDYNVLPHYAIDQHPDLDVLIVAGGIHTKEMFNTPVIRWITEQNKTVKTLASVCTGAFLLAEAGVLSHLTVTTHWEDIPDLKQNYADLTVVDNVRWVDQGRILTSGGISAGIDMSLHLLSKLYDTDLAVKTARQMEFDWRLNGICS